MIIAILLIAAALVALSYRVGRLRGYHKGLLASDEEKIRELRRRLNKRFTFIEVGGSG